MFMVIDSFFVEIIRDYYRVHCLIGARDGTSFTKSRRGSSPRGRFYIYWMELLTLRCFEYSHTYLTIFYRQEIWKLTLFCLFFEGYYSLWGII